MYLNVKFFSECERKDLEKVVSKVKTFILKAQVKKLEDEIRAQRIKDGIKVKKIRDKRKVKREIKEIFKKYKDRHLDSVYKMSKLVLNSVIKKMEIGEISLCSVGEGIEFKTTMYLKEFKESIAATYDRHLNYPYCYVTGVRFSEEKNCIEFKEMEKEKVFDSFGDLIDNLDTTYAVQIVFSTEKTHITHEELKELCYRGDHLKKCRKKASVLEMLGLNGKK